MMQKGEVSVETDDKVMKGEQISPVQKMRNMGGGTNIEPLSMGGATQLSNTRGGAHRTQEKENKENGEQAA